MCFTVQDIISLLYTKNRRCIINIFYLDKNSTQAAKWQSDKHVVKMCLETAQILSGVQHVLNGPVKNEVYRLTHRNHPSCVWARSSKGNYDWLCVHGLALCDEYKARYGKTHKSREIIEKCFDNAPIFDYNEFTEPPQAMPEKYRGDDSVTAYRRYYNEEKRNTIQMTWKLNKPDWWPE